MIAPPADIERPYDEFVLYIRGFTTCFSEGISGYKMLDLHTQMRTVPIPLKGNSSRTY
jgi:hypothetical protein